MRVKTITDIEGRVNGLVVPGGTQVHIVDALDNETFYPCTGKIGTIDLTSYEIDPDADREETHES